MTTGVPSSPMLLLAEAKAHLGETDPSVDEAISAAIAAAQAQVLAFLGYDPTSHQGTETLMAPGGPYLMPARQPITAVASVTDVDTGAAVQVRFDKLKIWRADRVRFTRDAEYQVTYTAGFAPLPPDIVLAVKLATQAVYSTPAYDQNLTADRELGAYARRGPGALSDGVMNTLSPWRRTY